MRTLRVLLAAASLVLAVAACEPTGIPECDANAAALAIAANEGYHFDCDPDLPGAPPQVLGWTDHDARILYVWPARMSDKATTKVQYHELGHAIIQNRGLTLTQAQEESWSDGYSWCRAPQAGLSYIWKPSPSDCAILIAF